MATKKISVLRIEPEVIAQKKDYFLHYIDQSLPPIANQNEFLDGSLLKSLLDGTVQLWVVLRHNEDGTYDRGHDGIQILYTTRISYDPATNSRVLVLYTMTFARQTDSSVLAHGLGELRRFAREQHCGKIIAYTDKDEVKLIAEKRAGAKTSYLLTLEV